MTSRESKVPGLSFTLAFCVGGLLLLSACSSDDSKSDESGETIDVPPLLEVSIENDQQAVQRAPELSGQLPHGFPGDLPVYVPSSLVNFGDSNDGPWVELLSPHSPAQVNAALPGMLRSAGWSVEPSGQRLSVTQGGRRAVFTVSSGNPGTNIRVAY